MCPGKDTLDEVFGGWKEKAEQLPSSLVLLGFGAGSATCALIL
jgi:hypothetical protein